MKKTRYIAMFNLPPRLKIQNLCFWWMFLDYTHAPREVFGAVMTILSLLTVVAAYLLWNGEQVDVLGKVAEGGKQ